MSGMMVMSLTGQCKRSSRPPLQWCSVPGADSMMVTILFSQMVLYICIYSPCISTGILSGEREGGGKWRRDNQRDRDIETNRQK